MRNEMKLTFKASTVNEGFALMVIASFVAMMNPTIEDLSDVKTAVSEGVTNAIIHGYDSDASKDVTLRARIDNEELTIWICDNGKGIEDVDLAMQPFYTSKPEQERSGMGFTVMQSFMDGFEVHTGAEGTTIVMRKTIPQIKECTEE